MLLLAHIAEYGPRNGTKNKVSFSIIHCYVLLQTLMNANQLPVKMEVPVMMESLNTPVNANQGSLGSTAKHVSHSQSMFAKPISKFDVDNSWTDH